MATNNQKDEIPEKPESSQKAEPTPRERDSVDPSQTSRFLTIQMDVAVLIFGLLMVFALATWVKRTFF
jgi:hypothetical protein